MTAMWSIGEPSVVTIKPMFVFGQEKMVTAIPVISGPLLKKQRYSLDKAHIAQAEKKPQLGLLVYRTTYTQRAEKAPIEFDDLLHYLHSFYVILVEERKRIIKIVGELPHQQ